MHWTIFKINVNKIPQDTKFYQDVSWDDKSIFTYDNIRPNVIENYKTYSLLEHPEEEI